MADLNKVRNGFEIALNVAMAYQQPVAPPIANSTPATVVDEIGYVKELMKALEKTENILWQRLSALQGGGHNTNSKGVPIPDAASGDVFTYRVTQQDRDALNQTKAKEYFTKLGILPEYMTVTVVDTKKVSRK